ncbi:MAG: hypothetical protein AAGF11_45020, partial [Myxococcota bacterium]
VAGPVRGSVEAGLSGATMGMSDVVADALGVEGLGARREALGEAATGLELAGGVAASLATGGTAALAQGGARVGARLSAKELAKRGAGAIAAPTKLANRAGGAVERLVLGGAEAAEATLARRALGRAAAGAVEGGLGGLGGAVSESVIHDKPLTAEALVGGALAGAAFGGVMDGGTSLVGAALGKTLRGMHARTGKPVGDDTLRRVLANDAGMDPAAVPDSMVTAARQSDPTLLPSLAERLAPYSGADPAIARRVAAEVQTNPRRVRDLLNRKGQIEREIGETFQTKLNDVKDALETARVRAQGEGKYSALAGKMPSEFNTLAGHVVPEDMKWLGNKIDAMLDENRTTHMYYEPNALKKYKALYDRAIEEATIDPETGQVAWNSPIRAYRALDRFKADLGVMIDKTGGWGAPKPVAAASEKAINEQFRTAFGDLRKTLEKDHLWGKEVAGHQKELNATLAKSLRAVGDFNKIASGSGVRGIFGPDGAVNLRQAISTLRQFQRIGGTEVASKFDEVLESQLEHLRTVRKYYDLGAGELNAIQHAEDAVRDIRERMRKQAKDAALLDDLESLREAESNRSVSMGFMSTVGPTLGGVAGGAVAGPAGAIAGVMAGSALRPYSSARSLASLLSMTETFRKKFDGKGMVAKLRDAYGGAARSAAKKLREGSEALPALRTNASKMAKGLKLGLAFQLGRLSVEDKARGIERMEQQLAKLENPEELEKLMGPEFEILSGSAPETSTAIYETVGRLARFLRGELPTVHRDPFTGRPPIVAQSEADRFIRTAQAALDPESVVRDFFAGTLTSGQARALREVYPATYDAMAQGAQEAVMEAAESKRPIPYQGRVRLSVLLGQPLEPLMRPKARRRAQALYASAEPPGGPPPSGITPQPARGRGAKTTGSVEAIPTLGTGSQLTATRKQRR